MENLKVLRKLESNEVCQNSGIAPNTLRTVRLRTRLDLFAHLDRLRWAFSELKRSQPLLRAKVVSQNGDFYFAIDEDSSVNRNLENVHFLRIDSRLDEHLSKVLVGENLLVELVLEKLANEMIDIEQPHDILWKFVIIEVKNDDEEGEFVYEFIWHIAHLIADGVSMSRNFVLLLDLIHRSITGGGDDGSLAEQPVFAGSETIFEDEFNKAPGLPKNMAVTPKPEFLDPKIAREHSRSTYDSFFESAKSLDFDLIDLNSSTTRRFASLAEMIQISRQVNLKRKKFVISGETYRKLLEK